MKVNQDSEPAKITPGETDFFFGANASKEDGETLLAFDELSPDVQKAIQEKRKQNMITLQRNNVPQGQSQAARGVQFLKPVHVTKEGVKATILRVVTDKPDNFGNPVTVQFSFGGAKYSKGFKLTSDNLASLVDILGADETKWTKKTVTIAKLVDDDGAERLVFLK
jgi:hypothetical protein